ncbi:MAG: exodeoxyribonuclease III, partial [Bacteroidota bacterium]
MSKLNIISWNVNGIRAIMKKDFLESVKAMDPSILCLQETKAQQKDTLKSLEELPAYDQQVNESKARKGYSGTAILSKDAPISASQDIGEEEHDKEGRVVTAEYDHFYLVNVYVPNSGSELKRLDYRQTWDKSFLAYLKKLEKTKPVIACGDLNVAHQAIDLARPKQNYNKSAGYTQQEIDGFSNFLDAGFIDTYRHFYPEEIKYSYWSYRFNARLENWKTHRSPVVCSQQTY